MKSMYSLDYLVDTGLMFEINRTILFPLGLGLTVVEDVTGKKKTYLVADQSDELESMLFTEDTYRIGAEKFDKFMEEFGMSRLEERKEKLGYVVQELEALEGEEKGSEVPDQFEIQQVWTGGTNVEHVAVKKNAGSITAVPVVSIEERNAYLKKVRANKDGTIDSGDDIQPPTKDAEGNCNHVNVLKEKLSGGGSLKFCADCGQPLFDSDQ